MFCVLYHNQFMMSIVLVSVNIGYCPYVVILCVLWLQLDNMNDITVSQDA